MIRYFLLLTVPLFALDQWTKWLILQRFPDYGSPENFIEVIPGFFNLVRVHNTGMAFGLLNGYELDLRRDRPHRPHRHHPSLEEGRLS